MLARAAEYHVARAAHLTHLQPQCLDRASSGRLACGDRRRQVHGEQGCTRVWRRAFEPWVSESPWAQAPWLVLPSGVPCSFLREQPISLVCSLSASARPTGRSPKEVISDRAKRTPARRTPYGVLHVDGLGVRSASWCITEFFIGAAMLHGHWGAAAGALGLNWTIYDFWGVIISFGRIGSKQQAWRTVV